MLHELDSPITPEKPEGAEPQLIASQTWILQSLNTSRIGLTPRQLEVRHNFMPEVLQSHISYLRKEKLVFIREGRALLTDRGKELVRKIPTD